MPQYVRIHPPLHEAVEITAANLTEVREKTRRSLGGKADDPPTTVNGEPVEVGDWALRANPQDPADDSYIVYPAWSVEEVIVP